MTYHLPPPDKLCFSNATQIKNIINENSSIITLVPLSSWEDFSFVKELSEFSVLKHFKMIEDTHILQNRKVIQNLLTANIFHVWDLPSLFFTHLESIHFALNLFFNKMEEDSFLKTVVPLHESLAADIWYNFDDYDKFMDNNIHENDHLGQLQYFYKSVDAFLLDKNMRDDLINKTTNENDFQRPTLKVKKF